MRVSRSSEHLSDEELLAYLDAETSNRRSRAIRAHLGICWQCRSTLSELEFQAEFISQFLLANSKFDVDRSVRAKEEFLRWRAEIEGRHIFFFKCRPPQLMGSVAGAVPA